MSGRPKLAVVPDSDEGVELQAGRHGAVPEDREGLLVKASTRGSRQSLYGTSPVPQNKSAGRTSGTSKGGFRRPMYDAFRKASSVDDSLPDWATVHTVAGEDATGRACGSGCRQLSCRTKCSLISVLLLAVLGTIAGLVSVYIVAPDYVKTRIAATTLRFTSIRMSAPRSPSLQSVADEETLESSSFLRGGLSVGAGDDTGYGFTIDATAILSGLSPVDGVLHSMPTRMVFGGITMATFTLPEFAAKADEDNLIKLSAPVTVVNRDAFNAFGSALLLQRSMTFVLSGTASVSTTVAGTTVTISGVPFDKEVTIAGAAGLAGGQVLDFSLTGSNATAALANLTVLMLNPSPVSIDPLGDLAVDVVYEGAYMGTMLAANLSLVAGTNVVTMLGQLVSSNLSKTNKLISAYLGGVPVNVTAVGLPGWPTSNPLYAPLLGVVRITTELQGAPFPLVRAVVVDHMSLAPAGVAAVAVDLNATVVVNNLLGEASPILVRTVAMNVSLKGGDATLGQLVVPATPVSAAEPGAEDGPFPPLFGYQTVVAVPNPEYAMRLRQLLETGAASVGAAHNQQQQQQQQQLQQSFEGGMGGPLEYLQIASSSRPLLRMRPTIFPALPPPELLASEDQAGERWLRQLRREWEEEEEGGAAALEVDPRTLPGLNVSMHIAALLSIEETAAQFSGFILAFIGNETVQLGLVGPDTEAMQVSLSCVLGDLDVHIPLVSQTAVPGLGGFPYVAVDAFSVAGVRVPPEVLEPCIDVEMQVTILNPSPASFSLGEVAILGILVEGQRVGASSAVNCTLQPGYNTLHLNGTLAPPPGALAATSRLFSDYLNGIPGKVTVVGESVEVGGGQVTPQWLIDAVQSISLAAVLPPAQNLTVFAEVELVSLSVEWLPAPPPPLQLLLSDGSGANSAAYVGSSSVGGVGAAIPYMSGVVTGNIHLPFTVPVDIASVNLTLVLCDPGSGQPMATVELNNQHATYTPVAGGGPGNISGNAPIVGVMRMALTPAPLQVVGDGSLFAGYMKQAVTQPSAALLLRGTAAPVVSMAIGNLSITNVTVLQLVDTPGMNGFSHPAPTVVSVFVSDTTLHSVTMVVGMNISNPSIVTGRLGPVSLNLTYKGIVVSSAYIADLYIVPGPNLLSATGVFVMPDAEADPALFAAASEFLSQYLMGKQTTIGLLGSAASSPYPLLQPAFATFNTQCDFPGLSDKLIVNGTLYADLFINGTLNVPTRPPGTLFVHNPLAVPFALLNASLHVYVCDNETTDGGACYNDNYGGSIGYFYDGDLSQRPIVVPPYALQRSEVYPITTNGGVGDDAILIYEILVGGDAVTKVNGTIWTRVGLFESSLFFEELGVPLFLLPANETPTDGYGWRAAAPALAEAAQAGGPGGD